MRGSVTPKASLRIRFTDPERPKRSCMAAAPTKAGITSGSTPSVWMRIAPRNWKRTVR